MNTLAKLVLIGSYLCLQNLYAQDKNGILKKYDYYFSLGTGISLLNDVPKDIYQESHSNFQIGLFLERNLNKRYSILSGIELERAIYSLDVSFEPLRRSISLNQAVE